MLTLSFEFLAGRYHATSWEHQVNEGTVEWPPSPWRLSRALVAASYKLHPELPPELLRRVLEPLLAPPLYVVPAATTGHTRHYMPTDDKPTKVFDAFVAPAGWLEVHWPDAALGTEELGALDRILWALTYLGRAESWTEVRRIDTPTKTLNCVPAPDGALQLWAAEPPEAYVAWRQRFEAEQAGLPRKQRREAPADWWDVLHADTGRLSKDGWSRPPGSRFVRYRFEPDKIAAPRRHRARPVVAPTVARFALSSSVLPRLTVALSVGDRVRQALLYHSNGHAVFHGRDAEDQIAHGHGHAWFLPSDDDADGLLDHVVVHARDGFDRAALRALERLRRVWGYGGHDLELALTGLGSAADLGRVGRDPRSPTRSPQLGFARVWESQTPFVPPRHTKVRGGVVRDAPEEQVARLLEMQGFSRPAVERIEADALTLCSAPPIAWYRFQRLRSRGGGRRASHGAFGFRIRFEQAVTGPLAVGYAAHQGLGQFIAVEE
ncbi:MAG TPA: type I-U CRISPR-associated protein Csb2 [Kofleriaceae bacterium]|nr:type I-U CRISPR-associated protein Csb2 [Kofleriaceae bacterium]